MNIHTQENISSLWPHGSCGQCFHCEARSQSICSAINSEDMARMSQYSHSLAISSGNMFIQEGEIATDFYIVTSGHAKIFTMMPDGRRQITDFVYRGDFIGFIIGTTYAFSAEALGALTVCRFSRTGLAMLRRQFPKLEDRLLEEASRGLVKAQRRMLLLGRKTARERLASFLLEQSLRVLHPTNQILLPMSRTGIADYLGLTIETVSRTLNAFRREKLITIKQVTRIAFLNRPALEAIAHGE